MKDLAPFMGEKGAGAANCPAAGLPGTSPPAQGLREQLDGLVEMGPTDRIFTQPTEQATEDYISGRFG